MNKRMMMLFAIFAISTLSVYSQIAVGFAYGPNNNCRSLDTAKGFAFEHDGSGDTRLSVLSDKVEEKLKDEYGSDTKVLSWTSSKKYGFLVGFTYWISTHKCWKVGYGYGFGDTASEAENNALKKAESYKSYGENFRTYWVYGLIKTD